MKRVVMPTLVIVALLAMSPMSASADPTTMHVATTTQGNEAQSGNGWTFDVLDPGITVLELGVYDSGADGIAGTDTVLTTVLFDGQRKVIAQESFTMVDPGTFDAASNYWFKPISRLTLAVGQYTIVGYGWSAANMNHNTFYGGLDWPIFNGDGVQFVQSVWGAWPGTDVPPTFPADAWPGWDFYDGPNMIYEKVPLPGAVLLGAMGLGFAGYLRRRLSL